MKYISRKIKENLSAFKLSISQKLIMVFVSVLVIFSASLFFTFRLLQDINDTHKRLTHDGITVLAQAKSVSDSIVLHGFELRSLIRNNILAYNEDPTKDIASLDMHLKDLHINIQDLERSNFLLAHDKEAAKILFAQIEKNYLDVNQMLFKAIPDLKQETDITRKEIRKIISKIEIILKQFMLDKKSINNQNQFYYQNIRQNLSLLEAKIVSFNYSFSKQEIQRSRLGYKKAIENMSHILLKCSNNIICQDIAVSTEKLLKHTSHKEGYFYNLLYIRQMLDRVENIATKVEQQNIQLNGYISNATESKNYYLQEKIENLEETIFSGKIFVITSIIIMLLISLGVLFFFIIPFITNRIRRISAQTYDIANGQLDKQVLPEGSDEITQMSEALEYFRKQLIKKKEIENERENLVENLLSSNNELKRFAYICSHDLQEPARMVALFSQKILEKYNHLLDEDAKLKRYFDFIHDGGMRMQQMIKDILDYSNISGTVKESEIISLNKIIDNQIAYFESIYPDISIIRDDLPNIRGHETRYMQIFQNLIGNGLKYQKPDARPEINISYTENDTEWVFCVADNGIGIEEKDLNKIFDIFTRLHRRDEYIGSGIGLAICQKVAQSYGGKIWVTSEYGHGSRFIFSIPKDV